MVDNGIRLQVSLSGVLLPPHKYPVLSITTLPLTSIVQLPDCASNEIFIKLLYFEKRKQEERTYFHRTQLMLFQFLRRHMNLNERIYFTSQSNSFMYPLPALVVFENVRLDVSSCEASMGRGSLAVFWHDRHVEIPNREKLQSAKETRTFREI